MLALQYGESLSLLLLLTLTHYVTDFGLQSEAMAKGKAGQLAALPGQPSQLDWLIAHGAINAAGVLAVTGSPLAALIELLTHTGIDAAKAAGRLSYRQDQVLHAACKLIIVLMLMLI